MAVQLAKLHEAVVCTTVSSQEEAVLAHQPGADHLTIYTEREFVQAALDWTQGEGVDLDIDTVGGATFYRTFPAARVYGDVVTIMEPPAYPNWKTARDRNLRIGYELMSTPMLQGVVTAPGKNSRTVCQLD